MAERTSIVGDILRQQGRSVSWFCREVGISRAQFYRIELGERRPSPAYRKQAARVLGVPETLLFLPGESPSGDDSAPTGERAAS